MSLTHAGSWGGQLVKEAVYNVYQYNSSDPATLYSDASKDEAIGSSFATGLYGDALIWTDPGNYEIVQLGGPPNRIPIVVPVNPLDVGSGGSLTVVPIDHASSPYTVSNGENVLLVSTVTSGTVVVDPPVTPTSGQTVEIYHSDPTSTLNSTTFSGTIADFSGSLALTGSGASVVLEYDAVNWKITGGSTFPTVVVIDNPIPAVFSSSAGSGILSTTLGGSPQVQVIAADGTGNRRLVSSTINNHHAQTQAFAQDASGSDASLFADMSSRGDSSGTIGSITLAAKDSSSIEVQASLTAEADDAAHSVLLGLLGPSGESAQVGVAADGTTALSVAGDAITNSANSRYRGATQGTPAATGSSTLDPGDVIPNVTAGAVGVWVVDADGNPYLIRSRALAFQTGTYEIGSSDDVIILSAGGGANAILPDATTIPIGQQFTVKRNDPSNTLSVDTTAGQTIDGAASVSLSSDYMAVTVACDGANWQVVGQVATTIL